MILDYNIMIVSKKVMKLKIKEIVMNAYTKQAYEMLKYTQKEMMNCTQRESINSLYSQCRVWLRCYYFITGSCSEDMYHYLGNRFKSFRNDARRALR